MANIKLSWENNDKEEWPSCDEINGIGGCGEQGGTIFKEGGDA